MSVNSNKINVLKSVMIKIRDKFKIMHIMKRELLLFHVTLRHSRWLPLIPQQKLYKSSIDILTDYVLEIKTQVQFQPWISSVLPAQGHYRCRNYGQGQYKVFIPLEGTIPQNHPPADFGAGRCSPSHPYAKRLRPLKKRKIRETNFILTPINSARSCA